MANELQVTYQGSATLYAILRAKTSSKVWNTSAEALQTWSDSAIDDYDLTIADQDGDLYVGNFPTAISAGDYRVLYYAQSGSSPSTDDLLVGTTEVYWNGQTVASSSPVDLNSDALTTLDSVKRHLRITTSEHDTLLPELINSSSKRIERICKRQFLASNYKHWFETQFRDFLLLRQYPIISITRIGVGEAAAIRATYSGSDLRAIVSVTENEVILTNIDSEGAIITNELAFATYTTSSAIADAINAISDWSAELVNDVPANNLRPLVGAAAGGNFVDLSHPDQTFTDVRINHETGVLSFNGKRPDGPMLVEYRAGYEAVPQDISQIANEIVAQAFHAGTHDTNVQSQEFGDYSERIVDSVKLTRGQQERLRLYSIITSPGA